MNITKTLRKTALHTAHVGAWTGPRAAFGGLECSRRCLGWTEGSVYGGILLPSAPRLDRREQRGRSEGERPGCGSGLVRTSPQPSPAASVAAPKGTVKGFPGTPSVADAPSLRTVGLVRIPATAVADAKVTGRYTLGNAEAAAAERSAGTPFQVSGEGFSIYLNDLVRGFEKVENLSPSGLFSGGNRQKLSPIP